jgi:membrane protein
MKIQSPYLNRLLRLLKHSEVHYLASSLAYTSLVSLVPLTALILSLAEYLGLLDAAVQQLRPLISNYLTVGSGEQMLAWVENSVGQINSGALGSSGAFVLLFISTKLIMDVDLAVQKIWGIKNRRPVVHRLLRYWAAIILLLATLVVPTVILALGSLFGTLQSSTKYWPFLIFFFFTFAINHWLPNHKVKFKYSSLATLFTMLSFFVLAKIYSFAAHNLLYYNKVYGSLSSVFLFLIWLTIIWYTLFAGVLFCASLHKTQATREVER